MQCSNCGTQNPDTLKFCGECGTPAGLICPHCQARNPADATTCSECERYLATAPKAGAERRQLTVLFVDLVGSSSLSEQIDPEDLRELLAAYQSAFAEIVARYEGHIAQYLGDGILAYFGYPTAHEDDAARAIQAGLDALRRLEGIEVHGHRPHIRIGVHTGLVVIGDVGVGDRTEQLALGEAPNIAARLQGEAETDTMVISDATRKLVAGQFALDDVGSRTLKGISRPLELFQVMGRSGASSRFEAKTASGLAPFIGREAEAATIREAWESAAAGKGRTLLLRGEAGIGKSRLLGLARDTAGDRLHEVFEAECSPYEASNALYPITNMLDRRLGLERDKPAIEKLEVLERFAAGRGAPLEEALPLLAELFQIPTGDRYPELDMLPARKRLRTLEILAELLLHSKDGAPVLVLIEDLHWADPSTLDLVAGLIARQADEPMFMVCTTRPELQVPWPPAPQWTEVKITALPQDAARALIAGVVGEKPLPEEVIRQISQRTGGVPLFVEAVTRTILEAGVLEELGDRYELSGPLPPDLIPATVHDSLMARIDRLGADKPVAQLASAVGRQFSFELLQHVSGMATDRLGHVLEHLGELDMVAQEGVVPASTYTFKHALIQDAAYKSLLRKTRQEYHGRIAEVLVDKFPESAETDPALLARHFEGAGNVGEAIDYWMKAGFQAQAVSAERECIANLRKAISLLETLPADDPARLAKETACQLAITPALMATVGWGASEVERACIRARELCEQTQNYEGLFTALSGLAAVLFTRGEQGRALEAAMGSLQIALATENRILHVASRHPVGYVHYFRGEFEEARKYAEEALALFDLEQERALVRLFQIPSSVCCGAFLSGSLLFMGYPDRAKQAYLDAMQLVEDLASPPCTAVGLGIGMYWLYETRDVDAIAERADECTAVAEDEGYVFWVATMHVYRGWARCMRGDTEGGIAEMLAGRDGYIRTESGVFLPQMHMLIAEGYRAGGKPAEALEAIEQGLQIAEEHEERAYVSELHRLRGEIEVEQGKLAEGEASFRKGFEIAGGQKAPFLQLRCALPLSRLLTERGDRDEARGMIESLLGRIEGGRDLRELVEAEAMLASV